LTYLIYIARCPAAKTEIVIVVDGFTVPQIMFRLQALLETLSTVIVKLRLLAAVFAVDVTIGASLKETPSNGTLTSEYVSVAAGFGI
jgi:hypothetical protein